MIDQIPYTADNWTLTSNDNNWADNIDTLIRGVWNESAGCKGYDEVIGMFR